MDLYIVRHGIAVALGEAGVRTDEARMLSNQGRRRTTEAAMGMRAAGCKPERILTSPLVRARETAEIVAEILGAPPVETAAFLSPGRPLSQTLTALGGREEEALMVVGHMPDLAELAATLIAGDRAAAIPLKKASLCRIAFEDNIAAGRGTLEWLLPPSILRSLGAGE